MFRSSNAAIEPPPLRASVGIPRRRLGSTPAPLGRTSLWQPSAAPAPSPRPGPCTGLALRKSGRRVSGWWCSLAFNATAACWSNRFNWRLMPAKRRGWAVASGAGSGLGGAGSDVGGAAYSSSVALLPLLLLSTSSWPDIVGEGEGTAFGVGADVVGAGAPHRTASLQSSSISPP